MTQWNELALSHSASCFFNSLLREWSNSLRWENSQVYIGLGDGSEVVLTLAKKSLVGRHQYQIQFQHLENQETKSISFLQAVQKIASDLLGKSSDSHGKEQIFLSRVESSMQNIAHALAERQQDLMDLYNGHFDFLKSEQGLLIGHNFHPYPKTREGFSLEDYRVFSPEMAGRFHLKWWFVHPSVLHTQQAHSYALENWSHALWAEDFADAPTKSVLIPFPVHPWQHQKFLQNPVVQTYITQGLIQEGAPSESWWHPTSSLRSIYGEHSRFMLKFSLSVRLTNSIRHLTPVEVVRGMQVYDVLKSPQGRKFQQEFPQFHILTEPAFMALKHPHGEMLTESIVVFRENPFTAKNEKHIVLATLAQENPLHGESLLQKCVHEHAVRKQIGYHQAAMEWFRQFLDKAVKPLLVAQANYGILLGAHQQNLILQIQESLPVQAYFRDCQGTGYSELGFQMHSPFVSSLSRENGNILDNKGNILFSYYLIINSCFNVIAAMAESNKIEERTLMTELRTFLSGLRATGPKDTSCLDYLLEQKEILQKGNFHCSLQNINENTAANPLAIYNSIPNLLFSKVTP